MALVLRNFTLWVNENDEICSVVSFHEIFFQGAKMRFLASPASLLEEVSTGTQYRSVRAVTIYVKSIKFRHFTDIQAIFGHLGPVSANFGPKLKIVSD